MTTTNVPTAQPNKIGMTKGDYRGFPSTLCPGCGHNSIANQIITACYELDIVPEGIIKFSGIGCSSKSPTYFMNRSFGFNGLHGRMVTLVTGAIFADTTVRALGISGDGDTASIGMGHFKHSMRRNVPMVYIVENNGVYGLTKGQFSATAEVGLKLKHQGINEYEPVDICMEALASEASFIARSFAGDSKQVKELIKAALNHHGIAVLDIISPCVTFNNEDYAFHSYTWSRDHEAPLHEISFVPKYSEIVLQEEFEEGTIRDVTMHDGSIIRLKKLEHDYDPFSRSNALRTLEEAKRENWLVTGLIFIAPKQPALTDLHNLVDSPLNRLVEADLRPAKHTLDKINSMLF